MNQTTWTLIADSSQAYIYEGAPLGDQVKKVVKLINEGANKDNQNHDTERPGQTFSQPGPGRHALIREDDTADHITRMFAKKVADYLQHARTQEAFSRLILVSDPSFLGELRASMDQPTLHLVIDTVDQNITHLNPQEAHQYIQSHVQL